MYKIVAKEEVAPYIYKVEVEAPLVAEKAKPGQFIIVIPDENGERVPFTISDWSSEKGTITFYFLIAGVSTQKMRRMKTGERFHAVVGPLGKPATIEKEGEVFIGGGCFGIGAIYPIVRAHKEAGCHVTCAVEGRSKEVLYNLEKLKRVSHHFIVCTSDGRGDLKGKVHDALSKLVGEGKVFKRAYFIGCSYMMMVCSLEAKKYEIPTYVALNPIMVDGTGMCGACRVSVGGETKFACVHGPEFDGALVDWKELLSRNAAYCKYEIEAMQYKSEMKLREVEG